MLTKSIRHFQKSRITTANVYHWNTHENYSVSSGESHTSVSLRQTIHSYQPILSTTLTISGAGAGNSTQSTMSKQTVSAFTIDDTEDMDHTHHNIMVAVLLGIFMCISLTITISILVFCRKKNTVFMLQKCEQDSDLEMNDINTDAETSDSDYEFIDSTVEDLPKRKSHSYPNLNKYANNLEYTDEITYLTAGKIHENGIPLNSITTTSRQNQTVSINRKLGQKSGSPSCSPLLKPSCSTTQTGVKNKPNGGNYLNTRQMTAASLNFITEPCRQKTTTAPTCVKGKGKQLLRPRNTTKGSTKATSKHIETYKLEKNYSTKQVPKKILSAEHGFFDVHISNSGYTNKQPNILQSQSEATSKQPCNDSSILKMESLDSDNMNLSESCDLGDEEDENTAANCKLQVL